MTSNMFFNGGYLYSMTLNFMRDLMYMGIKSERSS